jgi:NAD(P)-dependent dehydrogenase (short-subunit alcohol dehydrogenase family)
MTQAKRIVLTGVTRGLGRALTERFVDLGHTVLGCGQRPDLLDELRRLFGSPHDFAAVDVTQDDQVRNWAQRLCASHGPPDLLLNNAAIMNRLAPLWELTAEEFNRVLDVNINGVTNVLRHWLPSMIARHSGVIVNFSSGLGRMTMPKVAPYCASKWAIEGLTRALAQELPAGMAAVPLDPGIIDTDMLRSFFGEGAGRYADARIWSERAVPFLLQLGPGDNGKPLAVPR